MERLMKLFENVKYEMKFSISDIVALDSVACHGFIFRVTSNDVSLF